MISMHNVTKSYSGSPVRAVDDLTLEVKPGEIFGFLGANGAGKTTTIKMVTGILPVTTGSIRVCDFNIADYPIEAKREIGFVPDNHIIYDKLTGNEYINFMADIYKVDTKMRAERAEKLLAMFKLIGDAGNRINTYSHGMKQKICIIGALIHNPRVWILDEPFTGLDPQSVFDLKQLMKEHIREGNTVFFSTHVLDVAEKLCDRIGIINKGKLIFTGTLDEARSGKDGSLEEIFLAMTGGIPEGISL